MLYNPDVFKTRRITTMSFTQSITGLSSNLTTSFTPPLELDGEYECGLLHFSTYNCVPNIDRDNNKFYYGEDVLEIPEGLYEFEDLHDFLKNNVTDCYLNLVCNNNTMKCCLTSSKDIHFEKDGTIGTMLGFPKDILKAGIIHESRFFINILPVTVIRIECDIVSGSYINGKPSHIIHELLVNVSPGYRIVEKPRNIIYLPVNQNIISSINIRLLDTNNRPINLRGEEVQFCLHFRRR